MITITMYVWYIPFLDQDLTIILSSEFVNFSWIFAVGHISVHLRVLGSSLQWTEFLFSIVFCLSSQKPRHFMYVTWISNHCTPQKHQRGAAKHVR